MYKAMFRCIMHSIVSVCVRGRAQRNNCSKSRRVSLRARETQCLLEEQLPTTSQEDQNSRRISQKVCGRRKGGPVVVSKCPCSTGNSSMEPTPTGSGEHYFPSKHRMTFLSAPILAEANSCKTCAKEGLRKQLMKHMCGGSSRKGPLGPRQGCGRVHGSLKNVQSSL